MGIFEIIVSPDHMIGSGLKQLATQFPSKTPVSPDHMIGSGLKHKSNRSGYFADCFSRSHDRERIETFYSGAERRVFSVSPDHMIGSGLKPCRIGRTTSRSRFSRSHDRERIETHSRHNLYRLTSFLPIT